jgi:insulysin
MRLSLLGVSLLAGGRSSRAAPSSSQSLCSTVSLEEIIRPAVSAADSIVVTKLRDDRKFKAITLKNKLRVLLVSDPASSRSAAAMDVHVGAFSDPEDIPGLAHFCEHMSFLGTKRYPNEEDFTAFLSTHGGSSNAYTDSEDTVYFFDVNAEFLDGALDRFSQFFISPLFTESATNRELNAIDSEHAKNINNDGFRIYQVSPTYSQPPFPALPSLSPTLSGVDDLNPLFC